MTTPTPTLSQRLAAHPRFRWDASMRTARGLYGWFRPGDSPDLADPATTGILLSWLPEATVILSYGCDPIVEAGGTTYSGDTLGEAVAEALLAQWGES